MDVEGGGEHAFKAFTHVREADVCPATVGGAVVNKFRMLSINPIRKIYVPLLLHRKTGNWYPFSSKFDKNFIFRSQ